MKSLWKKRLAARMWRSALGLSLSLIVGRTSGEEVQWRPVSEDKPATAQQGPAVLLDTPTPLSRTTVTRTAEPQFRPVTFTPPEELKNPVVRGQMPDVPRPLPTGPANGTDNTVPTSPGDLPLPRKDGTTPSALPTGPVLASPDPIMSSPAAVWGVGGLCGLDAGSPCDPAPCPTACGGLLNRWFGCNDGCSPETANDSWWVSGEYLMWWISGHNLPPLVTAGSTSDSLPSALGQAHTTLLYGGDYVQGDTRSGARFSGGYWFDANHCLGIDASIFFLADRGTNFTAGNQGNPGDPVIGRPVNFSNPLTLNSVTYPAGQNAELVTLPLGPLGGSIAGMVNVRETTQLWGADVNLRTNVWQGPWLKVDLLGGFRFLDLDENLSITENPTAFSNGQLLAAFQLNDQFRTQNQFYGGQLGLDAQFRCDRWTLDVRGKIAMGDVHQTVDINGSTSATIPGISGTIVNSGGLLALSSNIGQYHRDRFAVIPEVGVNVGYQITDGLRCFVGYNFLYVSSVVRPEDQIDTTINPTLVPKNNLQGVVPSGPARPAFDFKGTDFLAHGVNFGFEYRY